jgi:hypothetical protein
MIEDNKKDKCLCSSFDGKSNYFSKFRKMFNIIASSNIKDDGNGLDTSNTKIIKCNKCNSYYIWDSYKEDYYDNDKVSARKYSPNVNDDGLRKILETVDGLIDEKNIDERSQLLNKLKKIEINKIFRLHGSQN